MDDQLPVRAGHGLADLDEQLQARVDVVATVTAVRLQRFAVDPFQHEAGADLVRGKGLDEFRDARVIEAAQGALFVRRETWRSRPGRDPCAIP